MLLNSNKIIRTVLGDIPLGNVGHIQCHEHIFLRKGPSFACNKALCMDEPERSLQELTDYRAAGGAMIVDAQPGGYGRDANVLAHLSAASGVKILGVTGFHKTCFLEEPELLEWTEDALADRFAREVSDGMLDVDGQRTQARAGMIKVCCDENWSSDAAYMRLHTAAARAAYQTGAPVMVHTEPKSNCLGLMAFFQDFGVSPERLIFCHLDRTHRDLGYHQEILQSGSYLCYDSVHRLKYLSDAEEIALLAEMKKRGLLSGILLSLDTTNQRLRSYFAQDMGLDYILKTFIPQLYQNGFTADDVEKMCCSNAQSALCLNEMEK